jgi:hypothetical protein
MLLYGDAAGRALHLARSGAAYVFTGTAGSQTLTISAGPVTFTADAAGFKANLAVVVNGAAGTSLTMNASQHLAA